MRAGAHPERERFGDFVRRIQDGRSDAAERVGALLGTIGAPIFTVTSLLRRVQDRARHVLPKVGQRRTRRFHPRGDCADAIVSIATGAPWQYRALAERLSGSAFVRLSATLAKKRARRPDVLGCAIRFGGHSDDAALFGDQDLLLATIRRPWTMLFAPFTTRVHDYLANDYFAMSPFSAAPSGARVWLRLRPELREPGAVRTVSANAPISSLRASAAGARRAPAEQRARRLERAIASGAAAFTLGIGTRPWGPFAPLVRVELVSVRLADPPILPFDPFRCNRGLEPRGFVHALRRSIYRSSRWPRPA